jgi:hypothetical protein
MPTQASTEIRYKDFSFVMNPPLNYLEKVELILDLAFRNPKTLRYRDFYSVD